MKWRASSRAGLGVLAIAWIASTLGCSMTATVARDYTAHPVGGCDDVEVGVWEEITPPDVRADSEYRTEMGFGVAAFVIDPIDSANITLGTAGIGVYRTTDCGATWIHIDTGRNADAIEGGTQWTMAIDPVDPNVVYTVTGGGSPGVFKTTNGGVDWDQTVAPEYLSIFGLTGTAIVRIDPTDCLHLVIAPHFNCQEGHSSVCFLETTDGGTTWNVIENAPPAGGGARMTILDRNTWFVGVSFGGLYRTGDAGASWARLTGEMDYAFEVFHRPGNRYYLPTAFGVSQSEDGITWTALANAPGAQVVTASNTRIYAGHGGWCVANANPFNPIVSAPIDDPTTWTTDTTFSSRWGSGDLQYDAQRHMLYSSHCLGGFWRMRTE